MKTLFRLFLLSLAVTLPQCAQAADIRVRSLSNTATSAASDDYAVLDGATNGTRKILGTNLVGAIVNPHFADPSGNTSFSASAWRTDLALIPGADVQAYDADLTALAALSGTGTIYYRSAANTWTAVTVGTGLDFTAGTLTATGGEGGGGTWGSITGTLSAQTDLDTALGLKLSTATAASTYQPLATVLTNTTAAFTTAQETKLSGIATGATANSSDVTLLARANHTGTQAISTVTGLQAALDAGATFASLVAVNASGVNTDGLVDWSQLVNVPAGFADGTDDGAGGSSGTVTSVSVTTANGVSGSVATATTTPAITLTLGDITPTSIVASGNITGNVGTFTTGNFTTLDITTLNATSLGTTVIPGANGGTGVANTGKTITLGGNFTTSGAYAFTGTLTGATGVTFPTSGTLATVAGDIGAATATTATEGDNDTSVATTAFVTTAVASGGGGASVPTNGLILWPTASIGSLPSGFLEADGTEGTLAMTAIEGGTWIQRTTGIAPTVSSSVIGTDGTTLTLNMSEAVSGTDTAGGGFALTASGGAVTLGDITGTSTLTATANRTIIDTETVTLAYVPGDYVDAIGLSLAAFSGASVTNNSAETGGGGGLTLVYTDTFDSYANDVDLGTQANWSTMNGAVRVSTDEFSPDGVTYGGGSQNHARYTGAVNADQRVEATLKVVASSFAFASVSVRCQSGANTRYQVQVDGDIYYLLDYIAGAQTIIHSGLTLALDAGDQIALEVTGTGSATRLRIQKNLAGAGWVDVASGVDPGSSHYIDGGTPGVGADAATSTQASITEWKAYNL